MTGSTAYTLPTLRLQGAPYEIGKQLGELARDRVRQHLANQKAGMARLDAANPGWWETEVLVYLPIFEQFAPHFVEEIQGLARGAEISFAEALLLNVRDELWSSRQAPAPEACTSFACAGSVTLDGQPIFGQTKDTGALSQDLYVVTAIYQQGRPDLLQLAYAGEFGVIGVNSVGISLFGNSLTVHGRPEGGLPTELFRRLALESESIAAVLALVEEQARACPGCFTVGDATGTAVAVENTAQGHALVRPVDGILTHANHINALEIQAQEALTEPELSISHHRQNHLAAQLAAERGRLTPAYAMRCLTDHANFPHSICRHPVPGQDFQTTGAVVVEPAHKRMHTIRGLPCQSWPTTHTL